MRCKNKFDLYFYTAFSLGACLKLALYCIKNTRVVRGGNSSTVPPFLSSLARKNTVPVIQIVVVVVVGSERRQNNLVIKCVLLFVYCITSALAATASGALVVPCF